MSVIHVKSDTVADFTGTVTVFNSQGSTTTAAATDLVRPLDWNSAHQQGITIVGDTLGSSTAVGTNIVLGGTNNIQLSMSTAANVATVWIQNDFENYYVNMPNMVSATTYIGGSLGTSAVWPFVVPYMLTANMIRMIHTMSSQGASTSFATSANTTVSYNETQTHQYAIYSRGSGASASALQFITSTSHTVTGVWRLQAGATGSQYTVSVRQAFPMSTGTTGITNDYSLTSAQAAVHTSFLANLLGNRVVDIPFAFSLSDGQYFMVAGLTQSTSTNAAAAAVGVRGIITRVTMGINQTILGSLGWIGSASNATVPMTHGLGAFTSNATMPAAIPFSAISSQTGMLAYFQIINNT